jgi:hypothetical protein
MQTLEYNRTAGTVTMVFVPPARESPTEAVDRSYSMHGATELVAQTEYSDVKRSSTGGISIETGIWTML